MWFPHVSSPSPTSSRQSIFAYSRTDFMLLFLVWEWTDWFICVCTSIFLNISIFKRDVCIFLNVYETETARTDINGRFVEMTWTYRILLFGVLEHRRWLINRSSTLKTYFQPYSTAINMFFYWQTNGFFKKKKLYKPNLTPFMSVGTFDEHKIDDDVNIIFYTV